MRFIYLLIFLFITTHQSVACTCTKPPTVKKNWEFADQVFIGQVESIDTTGHFYTSDGVAVTVSTIRILESFKSKYREATAMRTFISYGGGSCDSYFENGEKYLIYGNSSNDFLRSSYCDRTAPLSDVSQNELDELRQLYINTTALKEHFTGVSELDIYKQLEDKERELTILRKLQEQSTHTFSLFVYTRSAIIIILVMLLLVLSRKMKRQKYNTY